MNEKDLFPDYQPKLTPDTFRDYIKNPDSKVIQIIDEIGQPTAENLNEVLRLFNIYKTESEKNPGCSQPNNIVLGADPDQYFPSEEEILVSELGKMIKSIIETNLKEKIDDVKKEIGKSSQTLMFNEIYYRHLDVMGSGRFFYAEKKELETVILL